jgi:hypothetical protein
VVVPVGPHRPILFFRSLGDTLNLRMRTTHQFDRRTTVSKPSSRSRTSSRLWRHDHRPIRDFGYLDGQYWQLHGFMPRLSFPPVPTTLAGLFMSCIAAGSLAEAPRQPESVTPVPMVAPARSDIEVRVPVGLDTRAPPGADLTGAVTETMPSGVAGTGPEPGSGEWVFVPIPFKNPLLGYGLQFGAGRLYKPANMPEQKQASLFGAGGMYAEGGSWAAAAGDRRFWGPRAQIRSTLVGGAGEIGYPVLIVSPEFLNLSVPVTQRFSGGKLEVGYEVREHLWLNTGFKFATTEITATGIEVGVEGKDLGLEPSVTIDLALITLSADWDSRSDQFYPRDGSLIDVEVDFSDTALGADRDYTVVELSYNGYKAFGEHHTLAWRLAGQYATGDPPFFALPWYGSGVDLRGYTPGTYIGRSLAAAQAEWRWQATNRIGLVAFGGAGGVWGDVRLFEQDDFLPAGGVGMRWRLTEKFRVNFRVDYAWGKDDEVLLISVGEAF